MGLGVWGGHGHVQGGWLDRWGWLRDCHATFDRPGPCPSTLGLMDMGAGRTMAPVVTSFLSHSIGRGALRSRPAREGRKSSLSQNLERPGPTGHAQKNSPQVQRSPLAGGLRLHPVVHGDVGAGVRDRVRGHRVHSARAGRGALRQGHVLRLPGGRAATAPGPPTTQRSVCSTAAWTEMGPGQQSLWPTRRQENHIKKQRVYKNRK